MKIGVILVLALVAAIYPADSRPTDTEMSRSKRDHLDVEPKNEKGVYKTILDIFNKHPYLCIGSFSMLCFWFSLCVLIPKQCLKRNGMCYFILCKCFCCKYWRKKKLRIKRFSKLTGCNRDFIDFGKFPSSNAGFAIGSKPPARSFPEFSRKYMWPSGSRTTGVSLASQSTGFEWR